jgi:hypothetical protein
MHTLWVYFNGCDVEIGVAVDIFVDLLLSVQFVVGFDYSEGVFVFAGAIHLLLVRVCFGQRVLPHEG